MGTVDCIHQPQLAGCTPAHTVHMDSAAELLHQFHRYPPALAPVGTLHCKFAAGNQVESLVAHRIAEVVAPGGTAEVALHSAGTDWEPHSHEAVVDDHTGVHHWHHIVGVVGFQQKELFGPKRSPLRLHAHWSEPEGTCHNFDEGFEGTAENSSYLSGWGTYCSLGNVIDGFGEVVPTASVNHIPEIQVLVNHSSDDVPAPHDSVNVTFQSDL